MKISNHGTIRYVTFLTDHLQGPAGDAILSLVRPPLTPPSCFLLTRMLTLSFRGKQQEASSWPRAQPLTHACADGQWIDGQLPLPHYNVKISAQERAQISLT